MSGTGWRPGAANPTSLLKWWLMLVLGITLGIEIARPGNWRWKETFVVYLFHMTIFSGDIMRIHIFQTNPDRWGLSCISCGFVVYDLIVSIAFRIRITIYIYSGSRVDICLLFMYIYMFYGLTDMLGWFVQTYHVLTSVPNGFRMVIYWDLMGFSQV
jgi:hypothetical protein